MRTETLSEDMYGKIKECMDNEFYEQTVKELGEPKTPQERRSFVMAYLHNDRVDRNGEARAAYRAEHEIPPISLMTSDFIEYDKMEHDFHKNFPIKTFTDVVKEQTGITINADLSGRMYFETDSSGEPEREEAKVSSPKKRIPVEEQLKNSARRYAAQHDGETHDNADARIQDAVNTVR